MALAVHRRAGPPGSPTVVLVHGAMDRAAGFVKLARLLRDVTTVRYDRRGYGRSADAGVCRDLDEQVDDLVAVSGPGPVVLVGHSFGGLVVLRALERAPALASAALVFEPPTPWEPWWPRGGRRPRVGPDPSPAEVAERFMRRVVGDDVWEGLPERTRAQRRREGEALVAELGSVSGDRAPFDPGRIAVRVVVGHGSRTDERHIRASRELAAALPRGELLVVPGATHGAHSSHASELAAAVRDLAGLR